MISHEDDEEIIEEVEYIGKIIDPRKGEVIINEDKEIEEDSNRLFEEVDSIREIRNKIITLHLYIEKAMDRILNLVFGKRKQMRFYKKIEFLKKGAFIDNNQEYNLKAINELRNDYAHTLEIELIESKYFQLVEDLKLSGYISGNSHHDKFQLVTHQILFELNDVYNRERVKRGEGKIEKGLTDEDVKRKLEEEGQLFWQFCKILKHKKEGYDETYWLQCPYCNKGEIVKEDDRTPGFKESRFIECNRCGLGGDGTTLKIETIKIV